MATKWLTPVGTVEVTIHLVQTSVVYQTEITTVWTAMVPPMVTKWLTPVDTVEVTIHLVQTYVVYLMGITTV